MFTGGLLVICLIFTDQAEAVSFTRKGRYIPNIKLAEEIDISDVTFTTPPTEPERIPSAASFARRKPRVILPVAYHKINHPGSINYRKMRRFRFVPITNEVFGSGTGSKLLLLPHDRKPNVHPKPIRPVYYLLGDDASGAHAETGGKHSQNAVTYSERDLEFLKSSRNPKHPKYSPVVTDEAPGAQPPNPSNIQKPEEPDDMPSAKGERVEFQMYGMDGPNSYKFGYDTGKGDNRHFRFEERDNEGKIKGHYGYMDNEGKMRIMKYEADPETGFHAGPVDYPPEEQN